MTTSGEAVRILDYETLPSAPDLTADELLAD